MMWIARIVVWPIVTVGLLARWLGRVLRMNRVTNLARSEFLRRGLRRTGADVELGRGLHVGRRVTVKLHPGSTLRLGDGVVIGDGALIHVFPGAKLIVGDGVHLNAHTRVSAYVSIEMGDHSGLAAFSAIHDHHHRYDLQSPWETAGYEGAPVIIGKGVAILARVAITEGVTIGDYTVVGANSVVTRDLPGGALCAGAPARVIRQLEPEPAAEES